MLARLGCALALFGAAASCTSQGQGLYYWGAYEECVLELCESGGSVDLDRDIQCFVEIVEQSAADEKRVPPGTHAYLGYLYYMKGDADSAVAAFESEKEAYPESTVYIDVLLSRMRSPG